MADNSLVDLDGDSGGGGEYEELEVQRSFEPLDPQDTRDLDGAYLTKEVGLFGKIVMIFMLLSFALSFAFLIFSYTPWGIDFLRELKIKII